MNIRKKKNRRLIRGARMLPMHHLTIRVPWHDSGWNGQVCKNPIENTSCMALSRISQNKNEKLESQCAGKNLYELSHKELPPCISERGSFMAPFDFIRIVHHPYADVNPDSYGHILPTEFELPAFSATCIPFQWMLRSRVSGDDKSNQPGIAERLMMDWQAGRESDLNLNSAWLQDWQNQLICLDTFFSAVEPHESLCFFYAKRTPLSEQSRRVIIGVGRVQAIGKTQEFAYSKQYPRLRGFLWERYVKHSIRPEFEDGFLFPYQEIMEMYERGEISNPEKFVAFAPDDRFDSFSYGTEHLTHDGAVASLVTCAATLNRIGERVEGPWEQVLSWIDTELNRLWRARGAFPGLGSALSAFGFEWGYNKGSLLAYELDLKRESSVMNSWIEVDAIMQDPELINESSVARTLAPSLRDGWGKITSERRTLLELVSRCAVSEEQALRLFDRTERVEAGISVTDAELIENPYLLFELDRLAIDPIEFETVDRGLFPDEVIRRELPIPQPSCIEDPSDPRRIRALVVDILEKAAKRGHTVLPRSWVIERARERQLQPQCPLGENILQASEPSFSNVIRLVSMADGETAYQISHLFESSRIIHQEISMRKKGRLHLASDDWRNCVDQGIDEPMPAGERERELEQQARDEKAIALRQIFRSRLSVLVGGAGTGKTLLLKQLCNLPQVADKGILLLAPTGKARIRLEQETERRGRAQTLAQFLKRFNRFQADTGRYYPNPGAEKCNGYRTVIVDECSMLNEHQFAALFDACRNVERYVLVGDPQQLPPIGAGRPFVDIVNELTPENTKEDFPCFAELTIPRRQKEAERADVLLASHFNGRPLSPNADDVWNLAGHGKSESVRIVEWKDAKDLSRKLTEELANTLNLDGRSDELNFELSLGGVKYEDSKVAYFWSQTEERAGAAAKIEDWQILSPLRFGLDGVEALNRSIQNNFRFVRRMNAKTGGERKIPRPFGPQEIVYGDKVINVVNQNRDDVYPKPTGYAYLANGDLGIVVGQYKTKNFDRLPWKIEVEFSSQLGTKYGFHKGEFKEENLIPLELAYALTVHKTQGSEFGVTFVVLPERCRMMSRELLYTALPRHKDQLVVLHQGPFQEIRRFSSDEYSEIAQRMTNLFIPAQPIRKSVNDDDTRFLEQSLIHMTERGELVRSKSELAIANMLYSRGIDYAYEQRIFLTAHRHRFPDFTISNGQTGITYYWEHLGLPNNPGYKAKWEQKKLEYMAAGILPYQKGGGREGVLIETWDDSRGGLNTNEVAKIIDKILLGFY